MVKVLITRLQCGNPDCLHIWVPADENVYTCPKCKAPFEKYPPKVLKGKILKNKIGV